MMKPPGRGLLHHQMGTGLPGQIPEKLLPGRLDGVEPHLTLGMLGTPAARNRNDVHAFSRRRTTRAEMLSCRKRAGSLGSPVRWLAGCGKSSRPGHRTAQHHPQPERAQQSGQRPASPGVPQRLIHRRPHQMGRSVLPRLLRCTAFASMLAALGVGRAGRRAWDGARQAWGSLARSLRSA